VTAVNNRRRCAWIAPLLGAAIGALLGLAPAPAIAAGVSRSRVSSRVVLGDRTLKPRAVQSIVGGAGTSIAHFPFQVALYNPQAGSPAAGFFCGGVILDATHVATAAHCLLGSGSGRVSAPAEIEVLAGSTRLSPTDPGSVRDPVAAASYDPRYSPFTSDYDVGVLTLARRLWTSSTAPSVDGVNPIAPLPVDAAAAATYGSPNAAQPVMTTVSGWGNMNPAPTGAPSYPLSLRSARVPLISESLCGEEYAAIEQTITPRMICAGYTAHHVDSCYGDSGGPLVVDRDSPANPPADYVLVGLVDFGNGCAQLGYAGVYTWIANPAIARFLASGGTHNATLAGKRPGKKKKRHRHSGPG
jgi:secreted trypsin-like serine protease